MNKDLYSLNGHYDKIAKRLNPYTINRNSPNRFRSLSDDCSLAMTKKKGEFSLKELAMLALNFTRGRCFYSGKKLMTKERLLVDESEIQRDHLFPASRCGLYAYGNVVISTSESNLEKSDMDPYEYYEYRFNNGKPTLFDTLDEAHEAITYLHELYRLRYPSAALVVDRFNEIKMPLSYPDFQFQVALPLYQGLSDVKYIDRGVRGATFEYTVTDEWKEKIWSPLLDPTSNVYVDIEADIVDDNYSREVYRLANGFANEGIDVLQDDEEVLSKCASSLVEGMSITVAGKNKQVLRALIRQLAINRGDINEYGEVIKGEYLPILMRSGFTMKGSENVDSVWGPLLDLESTVYLGQSESLDLSRIVPREIYRIENILYDRDIDVIESTEKEIIDAIEEEIESLSATVKGTARAAIRAVIRQLGIVRGDIDNNNNVINGSYEEIGLYRGFRFLGTENMETLWEPLLDFNSIVYTGSSGTFNELSAREIYRIEGILHSEGINPALKTKKELELFFKEINEIEEFNGNGKIMLRAFFRQHGILSGHLTKDNITDETHYEPIIINSRLRFAENLKDKPFWEELNNKDSQVWSAYKSSSIKDFVGSRVVHMSNLFASSDLSVVDASEDEINSLVDPAIDDMSKNQKAKMRAIKRAIIRLRESM